MYPLTMKSLLVGIAATAMFFSAGARSAVISPVLNSFTFSGGQGNTVVEDNEFFSVPRFNPGQGTLTSVVVSAQHGPLNAVLTADSGSTFSFAMAGTEATSNARITLSRLVGLSPIDLGVSTESTVLVPDDPPGPTGLFPTNTDAGLPDFLDDIVVFRGVIGSDSVTASLTDAVNLAAFTGTGNLILQLNLRHVSGLTGPVASLRALYGDSGGQIQVQYVFDETQSPGPDPTVSAPGTAFLVLTLPLLARIRRHR